MSFTRIHKFQILAVLAAVTEVIKQRGGTESETEYFAALVSMDLARPSTLLRITNNPPPIGLYRSYNGDYNMGYI